MVTSLRWGGRDQPNWQKVSSHELGWNDLAINRLPIRGDGIKVLIPLHPPVWPQGGLLDSPWEKREIYSVCLLG